MAKLNTYTWPTASYRHDCVLTTTTIFILGLNETRKFQAWLQASGPDGLLAQLKGEKLVVDP